MSINRERLSLYLKNKRVSANLSQAALAEQLGYTTPQFVSNWERGACSPPPDKFYEIVSILKINKDEFVDLLLDIEEQSLRSLLFRSKRTLKRK